ncbi:cyclopropane fatty-acyl-phospholipid synthase, partial [Kitasatospora sp. Ki12]
MMYSGGYWEDGEDLVAVLDEAQERKLDAFTDLARAAHTAKVLDVGCGWGTMLNRLTTVHGVKRAVGVTLSRTQADFVDALNNPAIQARVESWEDTRLADGEEAYDAAFCINALEHFVLSSLTPKEHTQRYRVSSQADPLPPQARRPL